MDIINIEKKLKKINSVLEIFKEDGQLTKIEKDLLKGYIRDLYDSVSFAEDTNKIERNIVNTPNPVDNNSTDLIVEKETIPSSPIDVVRVETKIVEEKQNQNSITSEVQIASPIVHNEFQEVSNEPEMVVVEDTQLSKVDELASIIKAEAIVELPEIKKDPIVQVETNEKIIPDTKSVSKQLIDHPELIELFADDDYTDISDKLSMNKIDQIASSIGINDRFYMISELFNGDSSMFSKVLEKLDAIGSLEGAKNIVLNEVAIPMKWIENNKLVAAEDFIKLVKRKYK
jgi:hypothetical protein